MKNVQINGNEARLNLKRKFYDEKTIKRTIEAFSENFEVDLEENREEFIIHIFNKKNVKTSDVAHQFLNYILSEMKTDDQII